MRFKLNLLSLIAALSIACVPLAEAQVFNPTQIVGARTSGDCVKIGGATDATTVNQLLDSGAACGTVVQAVVNGDVVVGNSAGTGVSDSGTLLTALAPKASPTFTGTVTLPASTSLTTPVLGVASITSATITGGSGAGLKFTGTIPVPTGTGTPTILTGSTDSAGQVTAGSTATSVVITFAAVKSSAPICVVQTETGGIASFAYAVSTSAITVTQTATSGNKIDYHCTQL